MIVWENPTAKPGTAMQGNFHDSLMQSKYLSDKDTDLLIKCLNNYDDSQTTTYRNPLRPILPQMRKTQGGDVQG